ARPRPCSTDQRSAPKKSTASASPIEKENSPASVEGMLPPHMEFASMKRQQSGVRARSAGRGKGMPASRNPRYEQTGSRKTPRAVQSLKETVIGMSLPSSATPRNGNGK